MAEIKEIEVGLGLSVDKKGVWVKGNTTVRVTVGKDDNIAECFARAFELADESLEEKMKICFEEE